VDVEGFYKNVKKAAQVSDTDTDWTKTEVLEQGTRVLRDILYTKNPKLRQGYCLVFEDQILQPGFSTLRVPARALGGVVERIAFRRNPLDDYSEVPVITQGQSLSTYGNRLGIRYNQGSFFGYHITNGEIRFSGQPVEQFYVRIWFYLKHPVLKETSALTIQDLITTDLITLADQSCSFTATPMGLAVANAAVDLVDTNVSQPVLHSVTANKTSGSLTLTISAQPNPERVRSVVESFAGAVSNFPIQPAPAVLRVYAADETDILQLQQEYLEVAIRWTAAMILLDRGDTALMQKNIDVANALSVEIQDVTTPRIKGTSPVVVRTTSYLRRRRASAW